LVLTVTTTCKQIKSGNFSAGLWKIKLKNLQEAHHYYRWMVINTTSNNISAISWWSILLVEETGVPGENHRPVASHWQNLPHNVISSIPLPWMGFELTTVMVIGTDCTGSYKSNHHTIMTTNSPSKYWGIWSWSNIENIKLQNISV
jgi:hypothetical protein